MPESHAQRIAKNTGYLFIRMILVLLVTLYTSRIVLKTLGFEDFGIYNVVGSVVVCLGFLQTALNNATYRYLAYEIGTGSIENLRKVYSMAINSHCLLSLAFFLVLEVGGVWFINNHLSIEPSRLSAANWVFQFSLITFCLSVIKTPFNSSIIAHEHMNFYAIISIVEVFLKLGVVFALLLSPWDKLVFYAFLLMVVSLVITVWYIVYCKLKFPDCSYSLMWDGALLKRFFSYSGWSLLVNATDLTTTQCSSIFFFNFLGAVANAALGIANQVLGAFNLFLNSFSQAYNPQIIKQYAAGHTDNFMRIIYSASKISYYLILLPAIPVLINTEFILKLWLDDYPPMAPTYIRMVVLYVMIDAFQAPLWQSVHATGNIRTHQILMASIKVLAIPSIYLMLRSGFSGGVVLVVWVGLNLACAVVRTIYLRYLIQLDFFKYVKSIVLRIFCITFLAVSVPLVLCSSSLGSVLFFVSTTFLSMMVVALSCILFGLDKEEKTLLASFPVVNKLMTIRKKK